MSDSTKTKVGKLMRVLVAGGVALAGSTGPALAAEKSSDEKAAAEKDKEQVEKDKAAKEKAAKEKKEKEKDKSGGGVKGW